MASTTPIKHVVLIIKENHTFDNYFGTFPGANGTAPGSGQRRPGQIPPQSTKRSAPRAGQPKRGRKGA